MIGLLCFYVQVEENEINLIYLFLYSKYLDLLIVTVNVTNVRT